MITNGDADPRGDYFAEMKNDSNDLLGISPTEEQPERSTIVAHLDRVYHKKRLILFHVFGMGHPSNTSTAFDLEGNAHGLKQFQTEFLIVMGDNQVNIFSLASRSHIRKVEFQGMFQKAFVVKADAKFMGHENFI